MTALLRVLIVYSTAMASIHHTYHVEGMDPVYIVREVAK